MVYGGGRELYGGPRYRVREGKESRTAIYPPPPPYTSPPGGYDIIFPMDPGGGEGNGRGLGLWVG